MISNAQATKSDGVLRDPIASRFFESFAATLNEYADRRQLAIRRYQQNQPIWMFHFLHPKGGFGAVQLTYSRLVGEDQGRPFICAHWHDDNEETLMRHLHESTAPELMEADTGIDALLAAIDRHLAEVLAWTRDGLKPAIRIFSTSARDEQGNLTSELERRFRLPVIGG
jgi:hypothetical protein